MIRSAAFDGPNRKLQSPTGSGFNQTEHSYCSGTTAIRTKNKVNYLFATNPKVSLISHFNSVHIGRRVSGGLSRRPSRVKVFFLNSYLISRLLGSSIASMFGSRERGRKRKF